MARRVGPDMNALAGMLFGRKGRKSRRARVPSPIAEAAAEAKRERHRARNRALPDSAMCEIPPRGAPARRAVDVDQRKWRPVRPQPPDPEAPFGDEVVDVELPEPYPNFPCTAELSETIEA